MKNIIKNTLLFVGLLLLGAVVTLYFLRVNKQTPLNLVECITGNGEIRRVILSDSTIVFVNSSSILLYPKEFSDKSREVYLSGEAYFLIKPNGKKFVVNTEHLDAFADGISFLITAYPNNEHVSTTAIDGDLNIKFAKASSVYQLPASTRIEYSISNNKVRKTAVEARKSVLYKDGYLVFESVSFDYIIKSMERHFNKVINYDAGKFKNRHFTVSFLPQADVHEALYILSEMIADLKYTIKGNTIYIN